MRSFKKGDCVYYKRSSGTLIGVYNSDQGLFFAHEQTPGFKTRDEITATKPGASKIIDYLIKEHFGYKRNASQDILNQHRFSTVTLRELAHMSSVAINEDRLIRKRHLLIKLARSYVRVGSDDVTVHRICQSIENVQAEIELDVKTAQHATGLATYE